MFLVSSQLLPALSGTSREAGQEEGVLTLVFCWAKQLTTKISFHLQCALILGPNCLKHHTMELYCLLTHLGWEAHLLTSSWDLSVFSLTDEMQPLGTCSHQEFALSPASPRGVGWCKAGGHSWRCKCLTTCWPEGAAEAEWPGSSGWEHTWYTIYFLACCAGLVSPLVFSFRHQQYKVE